MKKLIISMISLLLILTSFAGLEVSNASSTASASMSGSTVTEGNNATITIAFSQPVKTAGFNLKYDSSKLQYVSSSVGNSLNGTPNGKGKVAYVCGGGTPVRSITFTFKTSGTGTIDVSATNIELSIPNSDDIIDINSVASVVTINKKPVDKPDDNKNQGGNNTKPSDGNSENQGGSNTKPSDGNSENQGGSNTKPSGGNSENQGGSNTKPSGGNSENQGGSNTKPSGGNSENQGGSNTKPSGGNNANQGGSNTKPSGGNSANQGGSTTKPSGGNSANQSGSTTNKTNSNNQNNVNSNNVNDNDVNSNNNTIVNNENNINNSNQISEGNKNEGKNEQLDCSGKLTTGQIIEYVIFSIIGLIILILLITVIIREMKQRKEEE